MIAQSRLGRAVLAFGSSRCWQLAIYLMLLASVAGPALRAYSSYQEHRPPFSALDIVLAGSIAAIVLFIPFAIAARLGVSWRKMSFLPFSLLAAGIIYVVLFPKSRLVLEGLLEPAVTPRLPHYLFVLLLIAAYYSARFRGRASELVRRAYPYCIGALLLFYSGYAIKALAVRGPLLAALFASPSHQGWTLSGERNVVVLLFSQAQASAVAGTFRRHPDFAGQFSGFIQFTDTATTYPGARYSIPNLLLGRLSKDPGEDLRFALSSRNILSIARSKGFDANLRLPLGLGECRECQGAYSRTPQEKHNSVRQLVALFDKSMDDAYAFSPLRRLQRLGFLTEQTQHEIYHSWKLDAGVFRSAYEHLQIAPRGTRVEYRHFRMTQEPIAYGRDCTPGKGFWSDQTLPAAEEELYCALTLIGNFLDALRKHGIYDRSMIFVVGDSGYGAKMNNQQGDLLAPYLLFRGSNRAGTDSVVPAGAYNPVLLYKAFGATGGLRSSAAPASLLDVPATICNTIGGCDLALEGEPLDGALPKKRERRFWRYFGGGPAKRFEAGGDRLNQRLDWWELRTFVGPIEPVLVNALATAPGTDAATAGRAR